MNPNLKKFKIVPSVVEADKESTVTVTSIDGNFRFFDDITYEIEFVPLDESDVPMDKEISLRGFNKNRNKFYIKPENGELKLKYFFSGEQEWRIHISTKEYGKYQNPLYEKYVPYWNSLIAAPEHGIDLSIYSLKEDLYKKRVLRGDLHIHTYVSDGKESPEMVAAYYRKEGYDFIAVTDHNVFNTSKKAKEKLSFIDNFKIMHGEEVHNGYAGYFHMVNIGGNYSVNDIYLNNPKRIEKEVEELGKEIEVPQNLDKNEYLNREWLYREIKKSGGYAIYPHPYWYIGYYHTPTKMSKAIIKNGLCDAFEVIGGCTPEEVNMQVALYNDLRAEGCDIPIVGSTDSHSVLGNDRFTYASTIAFAENDKVLDAISDGYSVAVESLPEENVRVYGKLRLVMYTHFLLKNYFPVHNELCVASGMFINEYVHGDSSVKDMIIKTEEKISEFEKKFFGR